MTLWWIGDVGPARRRRCRVVVYLLHGVLRAAASIVPSVRGIADDDGRRARRTSTRRPCC